MSLREEYQVKSLKFLVVGASNTVGNYALYVALIFAGLHYNLALILEYLVGILCGYLMNRHWTFSSHRRTRHSLFKYVVTYLAVYFINLILLNLLVILGLLGPVLGQLMALGIATVFSFSLQNFWVFRCEPPAMVHRGPAGQ
jgi:putative flippase GtrA